MLHTNFYEGYLEEYWIRTYLEKVEAVVTTVLLLLDSQWIDVMANPTFRSDVCTLSTPYEMANRWLV